jgi:ATP-binding cassette subfamily B protein
LGTGWTVWNVAAFSTFFACYKKLAVKSSKAAKLFNAVQKAQVSWKRVKPYLRSVPEEAELPAVPAGTLTVKGLSFAYPEHETLFAGVTFQAKPGEIVGVTGQVACGKSTLGRLFTGELPYQGEISMGEIRFSNQGDRYENCVGYLGHQPELFSGTVEENICLGVPGDIEPVLRAVCIDREVAELPEGIHTRIGSGGVRLSGGQQARIALARTLYHARPVIVLDDPFSAVDMDTEAKIFENLRLWAGDHIVLLISHRLALFPRLDQVLWMEGGTVTASSHRELIQENERYRALYESQRKEGMSDEN